MKATMCRAIIGVLVLFVQGAAAQISTTRDFTVPIAEAYAVALSNGYTFELTKLGVAQSHVYRGGVTCAYPTTDANCAAISEMLIPRPGASSSRVRVGINKTRQGACIDVAFTPAKPVACTANFFFFKGKQLSPGWKLKSVAVQGARWHRLSSTQRGAFRIMVEDPTGRNGASAYVSSITLSGPAYGRWQDAFTGSYRRSSGRINSSDNDIISIHPATK